VDVGLPLAFQVTGSLHKRFQPAIKIVVFSSLMLESRDQRLYPGIVRSDLVSMGFRRSD
jgi:hypothetical protein